MRRALLAVAPLVLGLCLLVVGFLYNARYGVLIPYQDPTPELQALQAQQSFHSAIAFWIMSAGAVVVLAGLVWLGWRLISSVWRRMSSRT